MRARARFTILYAGGFLASGVLMIGLTFLLAQTKATSPAGTPRPPGPPAPPPEAIQTRQLLVGAVLSLIIMAIASLLVGRLLAKRVLRPLRDIASATRRISADSLDARLAVRGPVDEVKDLADTVDELLERLEVSFGAQRRFVANASHELRTPLATMRASLDVAVAKPAPATSTVALADRLRPQLDRVEHLLDGFLVLARAQHGALADTAPVDLTALVTAALPADAPATTLDMPPSLVVRGSPPLLSRLVGNIIDNAVTHNEPDGWITIKGVRGYAEATLTVETGGALLAQAEVDRLTQPFERLGGERTGSSGLGLSIVAAVAAAHGGRVDLRARHSGGLAVTITLPSDTQPSITPPSVNPPSDTGPSVAPPPVNPPSVTSQSGTPQSGTPQSGTRPYVTPPSGTSPSITPPSETSPFVIPPSGSSPSA
ncbi:ATP-binding protein [Actinoplanes sp. NBRC 103695]|uniref:sensor histidine kinase n=1 Tax=Actinoplanes sp. NBRC 103695 TaxID=3032202 RepID=UPI0025524353|nr:ATP-binding protein [Actinoplanes sp. NBRC 103695]